MDIGSAQRIAASKYQSGAASYCVGFGPFSSDERLGYFLRHTGEIEALRSNGNREGQWVDFRNFVSAELERAEAIYPQYEDRMRALRQKTTGWRGVLNRIFPF